MRRNLKILLMLLSVALVIASLATAVYAEDVPDFTVTDKDGNEKAELSGSGEEKLMEVLPLLADGDTLKLNRDLQISRSVTVISSEDAPRTVNFDLGGHLLYSLKKITAFSSVDYTTLNIYSSAPGAGVYITNVENTSLGGNAFNIMGNSAVINAGEVTVGDVTYSGKNLSTYCSCLIDLYPVSSNHRACDANSYFNLTGGYHYSICADYSGYIIPRCGEATFNIKDANLITFETRAPINSAGPDTHLYMENCILVNNEGKSVALFNEAVGEVTMKDCITSYSIYSSTNRRDGMLTLLGTNVFSENTNGFYNTLIVGGEDMVLARTRGEYELNYGGKNVVYYDKVGNFVELRESLPNLPCAMVAVTEDQAVSYKFIGAEKQQQTTELWIKGVTPEYPFALPRGGVDGFYKYGWQKSIAESGEVTYRAGLVADFDIGVSVVYDEHINLNVYVPAFLIDEGYLDFNSVMIGGADFPMDDWISKNVDGTEYYYAYTAYLDETEEVYDNISIFLPCYFDGAKKVETTWIVSVAEYVERVLATEADAVYTEEEYTVVRNVHNDFFAQNG